MKLLLLMALMAPAAAWAEPIGAFLILNGWIATGAFVVSYGATLALVGASIFVGNYQRRKAKAKARAAFNASLEDRLVTVALTDAARSRVYGRVRTCDGIIFKKTRGANSEFYTLIVALAGHEIDAVEAVYFNDQELTLDANGYVQTEPYLQGRRKTGVTTLSTNSSGVGSVTLPFTPIAGSVSVTFIANTVDTQVTPTITGTQVSVSGAPTGASGQVIYQYNEGKSHARVRSYLGAASQNLSASLSADFPAGTILATDKFAGIACLRVDLEYSQDAFPTGVPQITARVRGAKVFDPRSGATAWSQNPALIARDWALYAYGGNTLDVSNGAVIAAANVCDIDTAFATPSGTTVMDTYQCGIVCKLDADPTQWLDEIVESMAGRWGWNGGTLKMVAGGYRAPILTIDENWITDASEIRIVPQPPRAELVNAYRPTISNRENKYIVEPTPPVIASAYVTADGQQLDEEISMAGVTHVLHAEHICGVLLRDKRQSMTVELPCNMRAWQLELFDTVYVTLSRFGWNLKLFEVLGWKFSLQGGVILTLKETSASIYDPDAGFDELGNADNSDLPLPWTVETITGLAVTSGTTTLTDGSIISRTRVTWTAAVDAGVRQSGRIEVQYIEAAPTLPTGDWSAQVEAGSAGETVIAGLRTNRVYIFRARAINALGVRGNWSLQVAHLVAAPPAVGLSDFQTQRMWEFRSSADGWTVDGATLTTNSDSVTITSSGIDPKFRRTVSFAGSQAPVVRARIRRIAGSGWQGTLYYTTSGHGESESFRKTIAAPNFSAGWVIAEWDMAALTAGGTDWINNTITGLRLDMGGASGDQLEVDWVAVGKVSPTQRPFAFRAVSKGLLDAQSATAAGLYDGERGTLLMGVSGTYAMARVRRADGVMTFAQTYDVLNNGAATGGRNHNTLAADLNATASDHVVVVVTNDEPQTNRLSGNLPAAMYRCGASRSVFGSPQFKFRSAYVLIGIGGCGEGNGQETYAGDIDSSTDAWCDVAFTLLHAQLLVGSSASPRSGSVDTELLTPEAATGVLSAIVTDTNTASIAYPSVDVDSIMFVTASYNAEITPGASQPGTLCLGIRLGALPVGGSEPDGVMRVASGGGAFRTGHTVTRRFLLTGGAAGGVAYFAQSFAGVTPGGPITSSERIELRIEIIKR